MSEAAKFIQDQKEILAASIRKAIEEFHERTDLHPSGIDIQIIESATNGKGWSYHVGTINVEVKI